MENNDIVRKEIVPKNQEPDYTMSFPVSANDTLPPDEKVKILSELLNFTKEVSSKKDLNNLLTYIVPRITSMLNSERSSVFIVDYENKKIYTRFAEGKGIKEIRLPLHTGVVGHTIDNNEIINIKDAYKDDRFCIDVDRKTGFITKNILSIPLTSHEDRVIGALQVLNKKDGIFTKADEDLLATISSHIGISIDNVLKISDFEKLVTPPNKVKKYRISSECLGEILLKNKMISWEDYRDTLNEVKETGERLGRLLIDRRVLLQRDVLSALAGQLDIDFIEQDEEISKNNVSKLLTPDESQKYKAIPISRDKKKVKMAMIDPTDVMAIDDLEFITQSTVVPCLVSKDYFDKKYFISYGEQKRVEISEKEVEIDNKKDYETHQITSWPIIKIVNYYLYRAMETRSSDIHFEPTEKYFIIRNRIDGVMHEMVSLPKNIHPEVTSRVKILCDMNIAERRVPQDGRFSFKFDVRSIDVRVSTFPTVHGEKIVMRLLEKGALKQDLHALGMDSYSLNLFKEKIATPHGMILLSGPTGSGKTTTLYSALGQLTSGEKNILTIEDPVEYQLEGVHQMQINPKINLTFASALRTVLRQDPDVIMVGEIRDQETAQIAIRAALTGHLVFSTLHTNDAVGIVTRLINMDIEPFLVTSAVILPVAQRLIRTICRDCMTYRDSEVILKRLHNLGITEEKLSGLGLEISPDREYPVGRGCKRCRFTGYYGRKGIYEMFDMNQEIRNLILDGAKEDEIRSRAIEMGMETLLEAGKRAVAESQTTFEEVLRVFKEEE